MKTYFNFPGVTVLLTAMLISGCNSFNDDPKNVLARFLDAIKHKDFTTAKNLATTESATVIDALEAMSLLSGPTTDNPLHLYNIANAEIGDVRVLKSYAKVKVTLTTDDQIITPVYTLKKTGRSWKVALDFISQIDLASPVIYTDQNPEVKTRNIDSIYKITDSVK
jgi:hypothetical protein